MDWTQLIGPGIGFAGLVTGGIFARGKNKADAHSIVIADTNSYAQSVRSELDQERARGDRQDERIAALERREKARDELARQHLRWDWRMIRHLADKGIEVEDPPSLFLYDDLTKGS